MPCCSISIRQRRTIKWSFERAENRDDEYEGKRKEVDWKYDRGKEERGSGGDEGRFYVRRAVAVGEYFLIRKRESGERDSYHETR